MGPGAARASDKLRRFLLLLLLLLLLRVVVISIWICVEAEQSNVQKKKLKFITCSGRLPVKKTSLPIAVNSGWNESKASDGLQVWRVSSHAAPTVKGLGLGV